MDSEASPLLPSNNPGSGQVQGPTLNTSMWLSADNNGAVKLVNARNIEENDAKSSSIKYTLDAQIIPSTSSRSVQKLAIGTHAGKDLVAIARADGSTSVHTTENLRSGELVTVSQWRESIKRFKTDGSNADNWVGLNIHPLGIVQSNQRGQARLTALEKDTSEVSAFHCNVPVNLRHFAATSTGRHFAYAGTEVNLSVWDSERAFRASESSNGEKRRRAEKDLFPAELWRAKNVANDNLDLRQPVNISSFTFLSREDTGAHHSIAVGNTLGAVHRYDTRRGKKPVSTWQDARMSGGVSVVERGIREHELYVADCATQLWAIDMRKAKEPLYSYKGISGKITSITACQSGGYIAAGSLDRYFRLLSSAPANQTSEKGDLMGHGDVVGKLYITAPPTAILPLSGPDVEIAKEKHHEDSQMDEDAWEELQQVSSEEDEEVRNPKKKRRRD